MTFNFKDFPKDIPLYKYLKNEHADFLLEGKIRIGTLFYFREIEQHGDEIGDSNEGKKEVFEDIKDLTIEDPSSQNTLSKFAQKYIKLENTAQNTTFINCELVEQQHSNNCFIYCMSKRFDRILGSQLYGNAHACIKIRSPYKFINCISKAINNCAVFVNLSSVIYGDRRQAYGEHNNYHASIIKPPLHKHHKEVRAIWTPKSQRENLHCLDIQIPVRYIKRYCELVYKIDFD
ncbi:hypothetical protein [Legionella pneumophila]|uniref:hypothetical protein n=1 Tax=Legionella pneumophila TaxID=446 RepID=UPI001374CFB1|nr:hypothetical protein [Legionella pneumophila]